MRPATQSVMTPFALMRLDAFDAHPPRRLGLQNLVVGGALLGLLALGVVLFRRGPEPEVSLDVGLPAWGPRTPLRVTARAARRGLGAVQVRLIQGEQAKILHEERFKTRAPWAFWGPMTDEVVLDLEVEKLDLPSPRERLATVEVRAVGAGTAVLSAPRSEAEQTLEVRLHPPRLAVLSPNVYAAQGGAEAVVYTVSQTAVRHGVRAGAWFFPGYPLPGGSEDEFFALFGVPYDLDDPEEIVLTATDDVNNVASVDVVDEFIPRPFKTDTIQVSDRVMRMVVPRIMAKTPELTDQGTLLANYIHINSELRKHNAEVLLKLSRSSEGQFYWNRTFLQMPAKVVSAFADRRTYFYRGREIDRQDHLGFDLASVRQAPIPAANNGKVIFAEYLGIYGNTVVVDHGFGLQSLYAHMSKIDVREGAVVERGQTLGRTGATGLALGDHLHFTLMLHGLPVTPLEWWDGRWIQNRIAGKLGDALGFVRNGSRSR